MILSLKVNNHTNRTLSDIETVFLPSSNVSISSSIVRKLLKLAITNILFQSSKSKIDSKAFLYFHTFLKISFKSDLLFQTANSIPSSS